ncbi:orotate phosphoribosyltransferase [Caldisalinibacter kiritimatiensis]|uniref:Orotate phosphoribosyltransferase n=1 Tax=Caldisalinibacter kiritimatiensis TaxID=1304284 RepID=R1AVT2_9FIRM|nr:orotate phosphoribosyltransferase [Caldisalinibacter kiritimatiensis]EOD01303.1 Orotate phosphoribosyltransferase [Caldisalinibacter kiritimatiensis]
MKREEILDIFKKTGVLLKGHFLLTSGKHSAQYLQCAKLFQYPEYSEMVVEELVSKFENQDIDLVASPAIGGIILGYETAKQLKVKNIFLEREEGKMTLRRGFEIKKGDKVLVVEDVVTTGGSVKEVIDLIKEKGGEVVGVGSIVNRSKGVTKFEEELKSVIKFDIETYEPDNCPLCDENLPVIKPGSRKIK